ncbi:MAG: TonB-dependent siderophore receptor, partial [Opitutales bacterium]
MAQEEEENIATLNPFAVNEAANTGYIATESIVATGFVEEISDTPMNIQVVTDDLMDDIGIQTVESATNYVSGVTAIDAPVSGNITDGGVFRVRGFQTSWNTRNGIRRYALVGNENVDRVEVIKGPLTVFFGQQAPGGIVNYVTKRPSFTEFQEIEFRVGTDEQMYASFESQGPIGDSDEWAYRFMISENDSGTWRDFEHIDRSFIYGGIMWQPRPGTQLIVEAEQIESLENRGQNHISAPIRYTRDWENPPAEAVQYAIDNALENPSGPQYAKQRDANGNLILDANGNPQPIVATDIPSARAVLKDRWLWNSGAWENDMTAAGFDRERRVNIPMDVPQGWEQNAAGPNSELYNNLQTVSAELNHRFNETFTFRLHGLLDDQVRGSSYWSSSQMNGAGELGFGNNRSNNDNWTWNLKAELLTEFDIGGVRNKILTGAERYYDEWRQF